MDDGKTFLLVSGWQRSGSTRAYNILRRTVDFPAIGLVTPREADLLSEYAGRSLLAKIHNHVPPAHLKHVKVLWCVRNPLDVLASRLKHPEFPDDPNENLAMMCFEWQAYKRVKEDPRVFPLVYERAYDYEGTDGTYLILSMAGVDATAYNLRSVADYERPENVKALTDNLKPGSYDVLSECRHKHVSESLGKPGSWRTVLTSAQRRATISAMAEAFEVFRLYWQADMKE